MTVDAIARHMELVRELSRPGGPLTAYSPRASMTNPAWWQDGRPTLRRQLLHNRILQGMVEDEPDVRQERQAIILAGPPGAGKGTIKSRIVDDVATYRNIDADDFKIELLRHSIDDGSFEAWLTPPEVHELAAAGERFFPLEFAALVHEESSTLAQALRRDAIAAGDNVIIDTVLSSAPVALELGRTLHAHGYRITLIDVEVPYEVSEARIRSRWRSAYEQALAGASAFGGRWVPSEYARDVFDGPAGSSRSEHAARQLATDCAVVTRFQIFRTTTEEAEHNDPAAPRLVLDKIRRTGNSELVDADAHDRITDRTRRQTFPSLKPKVPRRTLDEPGQYRD